MSLERPSQIGNPYSRAPMANKERPPAGQPGGDLASLDLDSNYA